MEPILGKCQPSNANHIQLGARRSADNTRTLSRPIIIQNAENPVRTWSVVQPATSTSIEAAFLHDQDDVLHRFLGTKNRLLPQETITLAAGDLGLEYNNRLLHARQQNLVEEEILCLIKLGNLWLGKHDYHRAAKSLNGALALILSHKTNKCAFANYLYTKLEELERAFVKTLIPNLVTNKECSFRKKRIELRKIRDKCREAMDNNQSIQAIQKTLTDDLKQVLVELITDAMQLLGKPPKVRWACMGMGSMSRGEMCPFSDIEFAFLIDKEGGEALSYFRNLAKILEIQTINLGETKFPVYLGIDTLHPSPTPSGFSMDIGGITPLGVSDWYELIGTPETLARFVSSRWIRDNLILANAMNTVCYIMGEQKLVEIYENESRKVLKEPFRKGENKSNREAIALNLLKGHLHEFEPDLSKSKEELKAFGIKKELYRPFQEILNCFAIYFELNAKGTFERIDELTKRGIFTPQGAQNLRKAIQLVLKLRVETHLFYQDEQEFLCILDTGEKPQKQTLYMGQRHISALGEIFMVLLPFHEAAAIFSRTKDMMALKNDFADKGPRARGMMHESSRKYILAEQAFQEAVSLNPHDPQALADLARIEMLLGKKDAMSHMSKELEIIRANLGEQNPEMAEIYLKMGSMASYAGDAKQGLTHLEKAAEIFSQIKHEDFEALGRLHLAMGDTYSKIGDHNKALNEHRLAFKLFEEGYGPAAQFHPSVACAKGNIGLEYLQIGLYNESIDYSEQALKMHRLFLNEREQARSFNHIGQAYGKLNENKIALAYLQDSVQIMLRLYGSNSPHLTTVYNSIASIYSNIDEFDLAIKIYKDAIKIHCLAFGEKHPWVAMAYSNLSGVYIKTKSFDLALECQRKTLEIRLAVFDKTHPLVTKSYLIIANILEDILFAKTQDPTLEKEVAGLNFLISPPLLKSVGYTSDLDATPFSPDQIEIGRGGGFLGYAKLLAKHELYDLALLAFQYSLDNMLTTSKTDCIPIIYIEIATLHLNLKQFEKAALVYLELLRWERSSLEKPEMVLKYLFVGDLFKNQGLFRWAVSFYEEALAIEQSFGDNYLPIVNTYTKLGICHQSLRDNDKALGYYEMTLKIRLRLLEPDHPEIARSYNNLACLYQSTGDINKAISLMKQAIDIRTRKLGQNHAETARASNNLGAMYLQNKDYSTAYDLCQKSLPILIHRYGSEDNDVAGNYINLANALHGLKKYEEAAETFKKGFIAFCRIAPHFHAQNAALLVRLMDLVKELPKELRISYLDEIYPYAVKGLDNKGLASLETFKQSLT